MSSSPRRFATFVRDVRLDVDDADVIRDSLNPKPTVTSETAKLLERLVEIDDACFPSDAGGVASARSWASSPRLRRATRLVAAYDCEVELLGLPSSAARSTRSHQEQDPSRLAAFASYTASSMCFEITKVACDPSRRRRGHARLLLETILNEARRRNVKRVALRVEIANRAAVALYESAGFVEDTSRKRAHEEYYGPGRHGTVYERLFS